ncbi:glycine cleavage system protein GcvH [Vreelandella jeotgali]|uniref:glycine cleavage system protein GcvH n=1 Tax=Vreelandella jeotgali TaxID=553386 RepID=UPI0003499BAA|nr:glycine cleavage system protein GcvH [Halomonas jeotgali]
MTQVPTDRQYAESHEWVQDNGDGTVTVGISDHAQQSLGDVVFVELPEAGQTLAKGDEFGVIESVKAASDLYAPIAGEIVAVNEDLEDAPENVNEAPYEDGWIMKVRLDGTVEGLMDADTYQANIDADA